MGDKIIMLNTNTNKILNFFAASLIITVLLITSPLAKFDNVVQGKPVWGPAGEKKCTSDFFSRTCCWIDDDGDAIHKRCETCIDNGDGTYSNCKITDGPVASENPPKPPKGNIHENKAPLANSIEEQTPFSTSDSNNDNNNNNINDNSGNTNNPQAFEQLSNPSSSSSSSSSFSKETGTGNTDQSTSFAMKGKNTETSPTPPECPKEGPIPPNCTMKPKF